MATVQYKMHIGCIMSPHMENIFVLQHKGNKYLKSFVVLFFLLCKKLNWNYNLFSILVGMDAYLSTEFLKYFLYAMNIRKERHKTYSSSLFLLWDGKC